MDLPFLLTIFGCVAFVEGIPYFLSPDGMKKMAAEMAKLPNNSLRIVGFMAMATGLFMVWLSQNMA